MSLPEQKKSGLNPGPLYLLATAILWSTAGVLSKYIPWGALSVACARALIAVPIQLLSYKRPLKITKPILLTAVCCLGETSLFMLANKMTSAGSAIVLQNTSPLYIMLMSLIVLKQKPSKLDCCAGVMIFAGIALSMIDTLRGGELPGSNPMLGNLLALLSGVFYAGIFFSSRLPGADPLPSHILGNCMYVLLIPVLLRDPAVLHPGAYGVSLWKTLLAVLFMGACQQGLAGVLFSKGISRTPSLQASFITMIEPVLNPILALIFLGEAMGTLSIIGSVLVVVTVTVHNVLTEKQQEKQKSQEVS